MVDARSAPVSPAHAAQSTLSSQTPRSRPSAPAPWRRWPTTGAPPPRQRDPIVHLTCSFSFGDRCLGGREAEGAAGHACGG